ncbi:MAG: histidine phosphatase family protein [Candidatus Electrothrix aestuarii]|uniref:Histidine phosphatase family protein n=1 Tax=Candidatus Electrothrix aestuarii TaxID=3062594 RepID=A0AAU8M2M1_9BACT|nr:histidine phosphatase family protein [Candidatus Electrothrix aestuarii]
MTDLSLTRLFLLRHGPTSAPPGCLVGSSDLPLSGQGLTRLQNIMSQLEHVACWYCSPLLRTRQTLEHLQFLGCPLEKPFYEERLREMNFGRWELQSYADIVAKDEEQIEAWNQYLDFIFPEGEAVSAFIARTTAMLRLFAESEHNTIGVMTHGGVIRTMICLALGISPKNYLLFDVQPASLTILDLYSEGGVLRGLNL